MAQPIQTIQRQINEEQNQQQSLEQLVQSIVENKEGVSQTIQLLQGLHTSGILEAVLALLEAKEKIAKIAVGQLLRPPVTNLINNGIAAAGALTEIQPDTIKLLTESLMNGLKKAETGLHNGENTGVLGLMKALKDPDINRSLTFGINFLKGMGERLGS